MSCFLGIALYIGAVEVNAQCECNVLLVCPTKVYPNKWAFWVFPSNGQKIGANQDLYLNNQGRLNIEYSTTSEAAQNF